KLLGERGAILLGIAGGCTALIVLSVAHAGWVVFAIMPVLVLGGIGVPALQSLATRQVEESQQGQFQGVLQSAVSLAATVARLSFPPVYSLVRDQWPGPIWLTAVAAYALALPLILGLRFGRPEPAPST